MTSAVSLGISYETRWIGPQEAMELLKNTAPNRSTSKVHIKMLAEEMSAGRWMETGDAIKFDPAGRLIDGQHRLLAIIESGCTIKMTIAQNVPPAAMMVIDRNRARTISDILTINRGIADSSTIAAALSVLHEMRAFGAVVNGTIKGSAPVLIRLLDESPTLHRSVHYGRAVNQSPGVIGKGMGTALHYLFAEKDKESADFFFDRLADGQLLVEGDPIYALRRLLEREKARRAQTGVRAGGGSARQWIAAITIKAWNAYLAGKPMKVLAWNSGGAQKEAFPVIAGRR